MAVDIGELFELLADTNTTLEFIHDGLIFYRYFRLENRPPYRVKYIVTRRDLEEMDGAFIDIIKHWLYESQYQFDKYKEGLK